MSLNSKDAWSLFAELQEAVDRRDAAAVSALLQAGADPDAVEDADDPTLLMHAAEQGWLGVVQALVEGGASVNTEAEDPDLDRRYGQRIAEAIPGVSALLYAGLNNHAAVYDFLHSRTEPKLRRRVEQILAVVKRLKTPAENNRGAKALCDAALRGDLETIRNLLASGTYVNAKNRTGATALTSAVALGKGEIVAFLLEAGADMSIATNEGLTAIHCATDPAITQSLLDHGADANALERFGRRPLHFALRREHDERRVRCLLSAGADVNAADDVGETPLHVAATYAPAEIVALLASAGADFHARTERGLTPLDLAWGRPDRDAALSVIEILRKAGAVPGHVRQLLTAAGDGDQDQVRQLLASGLDVNAREALLADPSLLQTPLHAASHAGHAAVVRVLLAHGADVAAKTFECGSSKRTGWTPLRRAAAAGHVEIIGILAEAGADSDAQASHAIEKTPLMEAAARGDAQMVRALLAAGADPGRTFWGSTAADLASAAGQAELAKLLRRN